jgi:cobalt-zinc-cadmium efflux system outer membrane protein
LSAATVEMPMSAPPQAGERVIGIQELIQTVLTHNPGLRQAQQASVSAQAAVRGAQVYANPRAEFQMGRNRARMPGTPTGSAQAWGVSQLIENPSARQARLDAAQAAAQGSEEGIGLARNLLVSDTRALAAEYLLRRAEAEVLAEELALLEDVRERVRVRVDSGEAPRYEMIKAGAEIVQARERVQTTRLQAEQVLVSLNRLAAGQLPARWTVGGQLPAEAEVPALETLRQQVAAQNPELRTLRAELDRARAQTEGAKASRWPGVEVRLGQSQEPDVRQTSVGLGMQLPLFDTRQAAVDEAASEAIRAQTRLEGRQAELEQELALATQALDLARLRVRSLGEGVVKDAEAALRVAQAAYKFGERGILEVLDAQRVLRGARMELLRARFQVQTALIDLDTLAGRYAQASAPQP